MALKIGLTGGIGSGKSTVAKILEVLGVPVYYADDEAKRLMNENEVLKKSIISQFGKESYKDGILDRAYLASQVFENKEKLAALNALTHPATIRDAERWMSEQKTPYAVKEAALIFESGSEAHLDYVIGVQSPSALRIERTMARDSISREEVLRRIASQMDEKEKMKRCHFIIYNDEEQPILPQVLALHRKLMEMAGEPV
jgi:dephospho-CoA kinase